MIGPRKYWYESTDRDMVWDAIKKIRADADEAERYLRRTLREFGVNGDCELPQGLVAAVNAVPAGEWIKGAIVNVQVGAVIVPVLVLQ